MICRNAFVVCISAPPDDLHSVCPCALLAFAPRTCNIVQEASSYKKMSSSTPKLTAHLFRNGCLNRLESSIPANMLAPQNKMTKHSKSTGWNEHSCDVDTHSLAFYDSDLESVSLDHT